MFGEGCGGTRWVVMAAEKAIFKGRTNSFFSEGDKK